MKQAKPNADQFSGRRCQSPAPQPCTGLARMNMPTRCAFESNLRPPVGNFLRRQCASTLWHQLTPPREAAAVRRILGNVLLVPISTECRVRVRRRKPAVQANRGRSRFLKSKCNHDRRLMAGSRQRQVQVRRRKPAVQDDPAREILTGYPPAATGRGLPCTLMSPSTGPPSNLPLQHQHRAPLPLRGAESSKRLARDCADSG